MRKNCIIDAFSDDMDFESFFDILSDSKIKKIFHSCNQDVEGLYYISGKMPNNIEDTQMMANFCGIKSSISYTDLLKETLKVILKKDKKIQLSNWKKRPLDIEQLEYAINDVDYLLDIYIFLLQQLNSNKNFDYYKQEMNERYGEHMIENIKKNSWKKVRFKIGNRTNNEINLLKEICKIREEYAIKNNKIRNITLTDSGIKLLMTIRPKSVTEWKENFKDNVELMTKSSDFRLSLINLFKNFKTTEEKPYIIEIKDNIHLQKKYEKMNDYIISESKIRKISPEIIINKFDLISFISDSEKLEDICSKWKLELFGNHLKKLKEI